MGELDQIIKDTRTTGTTPEKTMDRTMQNLRDEGVIEFIDYDGTYRLGQ